MTVSSRTPQRNAVVPPAVRPGTGSQARMFMGYELIVTGAIAPDQVTIYPHSVDYNGMITRGQFHVNPGTWNAIKNDNAAVQTLVHGKAEAVRTMKTYMADVSAWSSKPVVAPSRPKPEVPVTGIKALCKDIQGLVSDMAANTSPTAEQQQIFAMRYGKYRDAMADLRATFLAAEGEFETAQHLLVRMMGGDE